jgi:D-amino peptidase
MRIFLMTDMEGVSGVLDAEGWAFPDSPFYDTGRRLLTLEVNAAVDGLYSAGATSVLVVDAHHSSGIDAEILDRRTLLLRGFPGPFPYGLDGGFEAIAWVGQHAKAGADHAHLPHTGGYDVLDCTVNGRSVGELGLMALCASALGVPAIFASGDEALCREARALIPEIVTASVKRGMAGAPGGGLDAKGYMRSSASAVHMHPEKAREVIRNGAAEALARLREDRGSFPLLPVVPPFVRTISYRGGGKRKGRTLTSEHPTDLIAALNASPRGTRPPTAPAGREKRPTRQPRRG